ncbi:MAG: uncharacterized protein JWM40_718 [Frankiales bacterium]|nr:uncharacterized protein [Frankiales bacterium]
MRRLLIAGVVVLVALLLADRVTEVLAANAVAAQLRDSGGLREKPTVSIRGFPFLTQALSGRYDKVELSAKGVERGSVRLSTLDVVVRGAQVPLARALSGRVDSVPVESLTAESLVAFADLAQESQLAEATIASAGKLVDVTARLSALGGEFTVTSRSRVTLDMGAILLTPQSVTVEGGSNSAVESALRDRLALRLPVGTLPYGLRLTGLRVTKDGIVLTARSGATVLQRP